MSATVIKLQPNAALFGIKYWMVIYERRIPRYEVLQYVGDRQPGLHIFRTLRGNNFITRATSQLCTPEFQPFCLDTTKAATFISLMVGEPPSGPRGA